MTMSEVSTPQDEFWAGEFGREYIGRNTGEDAINANVVLFANILRCALGIRSILELGCNIGLNLEALKRIDSTFELTGFDINADAVQIARDKNIADIRQGTIIRKLDVDRTFDLTLSKTVLIHIRPDLLPNVYDNLYHLSNRYVIVCEYYNPVPVAVNYRGHADRLFKRDFAGEMIDRYGLRLVNYGFAYHRDHYLRGQDDVTWFLLEK
jgi:pseudaminic acid biosynthesis-associated methylase